MADVDLSKPILDLKGNVVEDPGLKVPLLLGDCVVNSLLLAEKDTDEYAVKARRFKLAQKIAGATGPIALDLTEKELIKTQANKAYGPLIIGRLSEALFGEV